MEGEVQQRQLFTDAENETKSISETAVSGGRLRQLIDQQDYKCGLSGVDLSPQCSSLDHRRPLSLGGKHAMQNVEWVHPIINKMKGTLTREEFILWCSRVAQWNG